MVVILHLANANNNHIGYLNNIMSTVPKLSGTAQNFLEALSRCTIRLIGSQNKEYFNYIIFKSIPIIVEDFNLHKYLRSTFKLGDSVQWQRNIFLGRKYEQCHTAFFTWNPEKFFTALDGILVG